MRGKGKAGAILCSLRSRVYGSGCRVEGQACCLLAVGSTGGDPQAAPMLAPKSSGCFRFRSSCWCGGCCWWCWLLVLTTVNGCGAGALAPGALLAGSAVGSAGLGGSLSLSFMLLLPLVSRAAAAYAALCWGGAGVSYCMDLSV